MAVALPRLGPRATEVRWVLRWRYPNGAGADERCPFKGQGRNVVFWDAETA